MTNEDVGNTIVTKAIVSWEPLEPYKWNYSLEDVDVHLPKEDEVLIEVRAAGICHTDSFLSSVPPGLHGVAYPKVAGHEGKFSGWNVHSHISRYSEYPSNDRDII